MALTKILTGGIADDAVTGAKVEDDLTVAGTLTTGSLGNITLQADMWRINSNFTMTNGVNAITNWERADTYSDGVPQGTGMSHSSGIFTFPTTGVYFMNMVLSFQIGSSNSVYSGGYISVTTNNSDYNGAAYSYTSNQHGGTSSYYQMSLQHMFDVQNVTTHKIKTFYENSVTNGTMISSTNTNVTSISFIRIGNT